MKLTASCVPNINQIKDLGCLCKRVPSRPTVLRIPSCRRLSMTLYSKEHYSTHSHSLANCRFHSLRQYLKCNCNFGYTSRLLLRFRLCCSFANQFRLNQCFTYCSLEYRRTQILSLINREFVLLRICNTNGVSLGQQKYSYKFCIGSYQVLFCLLFSPKEKSKSRFS